VREPLGNLMLYDVPAAEAAHSILTYGGREYEIRESWRSGPLRFDNREDAEANCDALIADVLKETEKEYRCPKPIS